VDGLILQHSKIIYGAVTILAKLRPADSLTDHLFVGTDRYMYFTLSWDHSSKHFKTEKSYVDQSDKLARPSQSVERYAVDPSGQFLTLEVFEGILTVIPLFNRGKGKINKPVWGLGDPIPSRIPERFVRSWGFLHSQDERGSSKTPKVKIAMIFEDSHQKCRLSLKSLRYSPGVSEPDSADFEDEDENVKPEVDISASHIIPVESPCFGFLLLAETSITYWPDDTKDKHSEPLSEATVWVAWTQVDSRRWLLADEYGKLYFLMIVSGGSNGSRVTGLRLDLLGNISKASTLIYLDGGFLFIGSNTGDSQVVKIQEGGLEVIQTLVNIAPIVDFTIMDMGNRAAEGQVNEYSSGQARIVTGSGAFENGSLRSVRSGVGLEYLGSLGDLSHINDLFSLQTKSGSVLSDILVASLIDETRVFAFDAMGDVEEIENFQGFILNEGTLLAQNVAQNKLLQVTGSHARVIDLDSGMVIGEFSSEIGSIVAASANGQQLLLSLNGTEVVVLDIESDLHEISRKPFGDESQISCVDLPDLLPGVAIVGFWQRADIALLKTSDLSILKTYTISDDIAAVPRSILLAQILSDHSPTIVIAMADGNVVTADLDISSLAYSNQKSTILGTQRANLKALPRGDNLVQIFATCENPSVIYGSEGRIIFSAVTAEKASCVCSFNAEAYPGAIAIASPEDLKIGLVDTERTTHVQTLHIGETVRRLAYSPALKAFGLGTVQRSLVDSVEIIQSSFKLADEVVFKELDSYPLKEEEIIESVMRADLDEGNGRLVERFVVGTAYIEDGQQEALRGRILIFEVTQDRLLNLVTERSVKGACRALATIQGKIIAALMKTVNCMLGFKKLLTLE
jgi:DNA damage-binding protein 1